MSRILGVCFTTFILNFFMLPLSAQDMAFVRQPLECGYHVDTAAYLNPGSGQPRLEDVDEDEGGTGLGVTCGSSVSSGNALANFSSSVAVAPDSTGMSINGFSQGGISTTWPDQWGDTGYTCNGQSVYILTTSGLPPDTTFTLTGTLEVSRSGYMYNGMSETMLTIYRNGQLLMKLFVSGRYYHVTKPDGSEEEGYLAHNSDSYSISEVIATDAKDGDKFSITGTEFSDGYIGGTSMSTSQMSWAVTVSSEQN